MEKIIEAVIPMQAEAVNYQLRYAFHAGASGLLAAAPEAKLETGRLIEALKENSGAGFVFISGAFLVSMEAVRKTGYLDPDYFGEICLEDWFLRLRKQGFSGKHLSEDARKVPQKNPSTEASYYQIRDKLVFLKKNSSRLSLFLFFSLLVLGLPFNGKFRAKTLAILDFLKGRRGKWEVYHSELFFPKLFRKVKAVPQILAQKSRFLFKKAFGLPLCIAVHLKWRIGDEIMAIPVYEALKKKYPDAFIYAEVNHSALVQGNPFVAEFGPAAPKTDLRIDLQREARHRPRKEFLAEIAGVEALEDPRIYLKEEELQAARKKRPFQPGLNIAVAPYPKWFSRRWPEARWTALVEYFIRRYQAQVFILGKDEAPLPAGVNLIGQTDLRETAAIIAQCDLFVGPDSGPLHLSLAVGAPSVGLFGPLNPSLLTPSRPNYIPVWTEVECRGCWPEGRMKIPDDCPKITPDCMTSISLERVIAACETLLARKQFSGQNSIFL